LLSAQTEFVTDSNCRVVEYAAYQLLTSTDATVAGFKDKYDFYIFPIVNPDGFAYTQATDRMWRKNRLLQRPAALDEM
jgi:murein tripeptide amidase MpaA